MANITDKYPDNVGDGYFVDSIPSFYQSCDYAAPVQVGDTLRFQFNVNPTLVNVATMTVQLIKLSTGAVAETFSVDYAWINGAYYNLTLSTIVHSGVGEHYVKITMPPVTGSTTLYAYSEKLNLKTLWANTVLLEYTNTGIDNEFFTLDQSGAMWPFYIRFNGGFRPEEYTPSNVSNVFADQNQTFIPLSGEAWNVQKLTVGNNKGIPNYVHQILNRVIFECDTLKFNGVSMCRGESSAWEQSEKLQNWAKSVWKIDLVETPNAEVELYEQDLIVIDDEIEIQSADFVIGDLTGGNLIINTAVDASPLFVVIHIQPVINDSPTQLYGVTTITDQQFSVNLADIPADATDLDYDFYYLNI